MNNDLRRSVGTGVSSALMILPFALACAACAGFSAVPMLLCCAASQLFLIKKQDGIFLPDVFSLLPVLYAFKLCGASCASLSLMFAVLLFALMRVAFKHRGPAFATGNRAGLIMCFAICGTILLTTDYFGIGATGAGVTDMLSAYRSLGFHPNFRGLLPGTITLVLMITYPRKFKKLKGRIPTAFAAILIPALLTAVLYRDAEFSPLNELSALALAPELAKLLPLKGLTLADVPCAFLTGAGTAAYLYMRENNDALSTGAANLLSAAAAPIPLVRTRYPECRQTVASRITACVMLALFAVFSPYIFVRIPVHSLAVVLIASLWQSVPWGEFARSLKKGGSIIIIIMGVFLNLPSAAMTAFVLSALSAFRSERREMNG